MAHVSIEARDSERALLLISFRFSGFLLKVALACVKQNTWMQIAA